MPIVPLFLFKLSVSLAVLWIFYQVFLRRLTFYRMNRWYLLGYTVLSFFIPLINIGPMLADRPSGEPLVVQYIPAIGQYIPAIGNAGAAALAPAVHQSGLSTWSVLTGLMMLGALLLLIRSVVRWWSLLRLRRQARLIPGTALKIYEVDAPIIPFSFGNTIYINPQLHTEKEWTDIILHEYVHIRQRHTVDILLAELVCMLNWYNPFAWLIRYSIRQNLEFIADQQVLDQGVDRKGYQYHLLKVVGEPRYRLANNFNFSSLKKRIVMMNKMRSARLHLLKLSFLVPLVSVLLVAFRDRYPDLWSRSSGILYVNAAGIVISRPDNSPLAGVTVREKVTGMETITDANGYYKLHIPVTKDSVRIGLNYSKEGYDSDYRERFIPRIKESFGILDVGVIRQPSAPREGIFIIAPNMSGRLPVDPDYADAVKELHRVLKENEELGNYIKMQKDHPEVSLFYITEDKQRRIVVHTDGTIEKYGYPGQPSLDEMDRKYGALPGFMTGNEHPVNSGYLARWAGISAEAEKEFHTMSADAKAIIFPGDSRVIAVPASGKPVVYDMDNDAAKERTAFERLYGKLPACVPKAGNNTDERERAAGGSPRPAAHVRDTVPGRSGVIRDSGRSVISGRGEDSIGNRVTEERTVRPIIGFGSGPQQGILYIIEGKEVLSTDTAALKKLDQDQIESLTVLKDPAATAKYGENGKNGVIIVHLKKQIGAPQTTPANDKGGSGGPQAAGG